MFLLFTELHVEAVSFKIMHRRTRNFFLHIVKIFFLSSGTGTNKLRHADNLSKLKLIKPCYIGEGSMLFFPCVFVRLSLCNKFHSHFSQKLFIAGAWNFNTLFI